MRIEDLLFNLTLADENSEKVYQRVKTLKANIYTNENGRSIRKLSNKEMQDPIGCLDYDFDAMAIIPLFDIYDNNFIAYETSTNQFIIINTIDELETDCGTLKEIISLLG